MNAEFIAMLDYLERERGIKREILLEAVSTALLSASKKSVGAARDLRIDIDPRTGDIVSGTVRRFDRSDVILDLGKFEAVMPQRERVVVEDYNVGDRLRAYVVAVENGLRGPEIIISRSHANFVRRLFELEVSEIADGTVEI